MNADKILTASNVRKAHPVYRSIAEELAKVDHLKFVKIYKGSIKASNVLSDNGKMMPVVSVGEEGIIGVELLVDIPSQTVQFYAVTSSEKGCGGQLVKAVVNAVPDDWTLVVVMDWSHGFWGAMSKKYPRLMVL